MKLSFGMLSKLNLPPCTVPLTIHVKETPNLVYTRANCCLFSRFYSYVWFLWFSRQFGLVNDQQGHGSAGSTVLRYFLEPVLGTLNGGSQDCIVIMTILVMISHSTNYLTALLNLFFSKPFVCGMWQKTHLHFTDVGAGTQTLIANRWPIWGQYPHFWLPVQWSVYFPTMSWATGNSRFYWLGGLWYGLREVRWPLSAWKGGNLWFSLSFQISKEEATLSQSRSLSLVCRQWGVQVAHCCVPRGSSKLILVDLQASGRDGEEGMGKWHFCK